MEYIWSTEVDEIELMCAESLGLTEGDLRRIKMMGASREDMLLHSEVESAEAEDSEVVSQTELEETQEDVESEMGESEVGVPITGTEADFGLSEECSFPVPECPFAAGLAKEIERAFGVSDEDILAGEETEYGPEGEAECAFLAETAREIERAFGRYDETPTPVAGLESVEAGCSDTDDQPQLDYDEVEGEEDAPFDAQNEAMKLFDVAGGDLLSHTEVDEGSPVLFGLSGENLLVHEEEEHVEVEHHEDVTPAETVEDTTTLIAVSDEGILLLAEGRPTSPAPGDLDQEDAPEVHAEYIDPLARVNTTVLAHAFAQMGKMTRFYG